MKTKNLISWLGLGAATMWLGCGQPDDLSGPHDTETLMQAIGNNQIHGHLKFESDYLTPSGQVPVGHAKMRLLYVCAWEKDGPNDFANPGDTNPDDFLGCARADRNGYYNIEYPVYRGPDIYLVTAFCDGDDQGNQSEAEVCVRADRIATTERAPSDWKNDNMGTTFRKYLWSYEHGQGRGDYGDGQTGLLSWNLSCPAERGWGLTDVTCRAGTVGAGGSGDSQNSNVGWNKDSIHTFRSAVETVKTFGTMKPTASNTHDRLCTDVRCKDEINLHIADNSAASGRCTNVPGNSNFSMGYDEDCITSPLDPFRIVHELGHNIHRRWMAYSGSVQGGYASSWCDSPDSQKSTTADGWANFVGVMAWFNDDMSGPRYGNRTIESSDCASTPADPGEGYVTMFFWDLFDQNDLLDLNYWDILKVWSKFSASTGNRGNNENGADGRNIADYVYWFKTLYPDWSDEVDRLVDWNSLDGHL